MKSEKKMFEEVNPEKKKCCICGSEFEGYGNNPAPVAGKYCCDKCNNNVIVPYRVFLANLGKGSENLEKLAERELEKLRELKEKEKKEKNFQ